jgi:hypothetical protein
VSVKEISEMIKELVNTGTSNDTSINKDKMVLFQNLLKFYQNKEKVIELILSIISLFSDEVVFNQWLVDESAATTNNDSPVTNLFLFLLSFHSNNEMIVIQCLSLLQRRLLFHKDHSVAVDDQFSNIGEGSLNAIKQVVKVYTTKPQCSKESFDALLSFVKNVKPVYKRVEKDMKVFFSVADMKKLERQ